MASSDEREELVETWKSFSEVSSHSIPFNIEKQEELRKRLIARDDVAWTIVDTHTDGIFVSDLHLIGGVDISFPKGDDSHACACLVVLTYPDLKVVYEDLSMVHLISPYIPEFLAFREVDFLIDLINKLKVEKPERMPQVIMVDGNGMLHPRGFGVACHLGVLTNIPTVGVAKNLFHVDGIEKGTEHTEQIKSLLKDKGDSFALVGKSGTTWGMALRSSKQCSITPVCKPIYISIGHRVGLDTAMHLIHSCCQYRIPEPVRQADILSREYLRLHYEKELAKCSCKGSKKLTQQHGCLDEYNKQQTTASSAVNTDVEVERMKINQLKLS